MLCREMGWTYDELERQPAGRVEEALTWLEVEAIAEKRQAMQIPSGARR